MNNRSPTTRRKDIKIHMKICYTGTGYSVSGDKLEELFVSSPSCAKTHPQ